MSKYAIKESKEAVAFVCKAIKEIRDALKDGIGISDAAVALKLSIGSISAIKGADQIPAELADLQPAEFDELKAVAQETIEEFTPDQLEEIVFLALQLLKLVVVKP